MDEMKTPEPQSRKEYFLRKIAYPDAPCPAPETREEEYLDAIAQNKGGGGGDDGIFVVGQDVNTGALDKTWQEIADALSAGKRVIAVAMQSAMTVQMLFMFSIVLEGAYGLVAITASPAGVLGVSFTATSADGYPVAQPK